MSNTACAPASNVYPTEYLELLLNLCTIYMICLEKSFKYNNGGYVSIQVA